MPLKFEDLATISLPKLQEELASMKRNQLQSLAKKCGLKANQRTLELTGAITEYFLKRKRSQRGGSPGTGRGRSRRPSSAETLHKTPSNCPVYNPRYAPTDTAKAVAILNTAGSMPSARKTGQGWLTNRNKELAELEAALQSMPPPRPRNNTPAATSTLRTQTLRKQLTGSKRKASDAAVVTPADNPPLKRSSGTTPADTLALKAAIIRRPGRSKAAAGPSRLGRAPTAGPPSENVPMNSTPVAPKEFTRGSGKTPSSALRPSAIARANKAHEAYLARMRKAQTRKGSNLKN